MIRRSRADVGEELPELTRVVDTVDTDQKALDDVEDAAAQLAKIILGRSSINDKDARFRAGGELDWRLRQATGLAKAPHVAAFVKMLADSGEKIVLVGWHHAVYDIWSERFTDFIPAPNKRIRLQVYERDGYTCVYCGVDLADGEESPNGKNNRRRCLDHVIPLSQGGSNDISNLALGQRGTLLWTRLRDAGLSPRRGDELMAHIERTLSAWKGTPYMKGQQMREQGVDCVRFVAAALAEMEGKPHHVLPRLATDTGWHDPAAAEVGAKALVRLVWPVHQVEGPEVQPGDIIEVAPVGIEPDAGGGSHVYIVGGEPGLWHAHPPRVMRSGMILEQGFHVHRIWRLGDRVTRWGRAA